MVGSRVRDVMTQDVAAVRLHTPYKEIVRVIEERGVSALPVLDDEGGLAGVVSEADLLDRGASGARPTGLLGLRRGARKAARKARGLTARALMTAPAVTVPAEANVAEAARTMARRELKRLPVVDEKERLAVRLTRGVDGVVDVVDRLTYRMDDTQGRHTFRSAG